MAGDEKHYVNIVSNFDKKGTDNAVNAFKKVNGGTDNVSKGLKKVKKGADTAARGLKGVGTKANSTTNALKSMAKTLIAGFGIYQAIRGIRSLISVTADFEEQMSKVGSLLGNMESQLLPQFTEEIRRLSVETGQATGDLAAGLFDLVSAGMDASESLDIIRAASKLAVGGFTSTNFATSALITVLQTFKGELKDATDAADFLFAVQEGGRLTVEQVSNAIGMFASTGKSAGVGINDLGAAFATLSLSGEGSQRSATQLLSILVSLQRDSETMAATAKELGHEIDFNKLATEGLIPFLDQFLDLTGKEKAQIFTESRALRGMNTLLVNSTKAKEKLNIITDRTGKSTAAYKRRQKELKQQLKETLGVIKDLAVEIGNFLSPALKIILSILKDYLSVINSIMKSLVPFLTVSKETEDALKSQMSFWENQLDLLYQTEKIFKTLPNGTEVYENSVKKLTKSEELQADAIRKNISGLRDLINLRDTASKPSPTGKITVTGVKPADKEDRLPLLPPSLSLGFNLPDPTLEKAESVKAMKESFDEVTEAAKESEGSISAWGLFFRDTAEGASNYATESFKYFFDTAGKGFLDFEELVNGVWKSILKAFLDMISKMMAKMVIFGIMDMFLPGSGRVGSFLAGGGGVPSKAKGGFIDKDMLANLHAGEYVLPKSVVDSIKSNKAPSTLQPSFAGAGANISVSPNINITGGINSSMDVQKIAEQLAEATKRGTTWAVEQAKVSYKVGQKRSDEVSL